MIIFGTRGVTYTKDRGNFHCPQCSGEMDYAKKRVRRFFTLYFIPLIPMDMLGESVECAKCRGTFQTDILSHDAQAEGQQVRAEFQKAMLRTMVHMMLADGEIDEGEMQVIRDIYGQTSGAPITDEEITEEIDAVVNATYDLEQQLGEMGGMLNENGKEIVMKAACLVAAADGVIQDEEKALLGEIAGAIQMTPTHARGVMAEVFQAPSTPDTRNN